MALPIFGLVATAAPFIALLVTLGAVRIGLRDASRARSAAWACIAAVVLFVVLGVAGYLAAMAAVYVDISTADAASKASLLAAGISEALNCTALVVVSALPPAVTAIFLFARARKLAATVAP